MILQKFNQEAFAVNETIYQDSYPFTIDARTTEDLELSIEVLKETKQVSMKVGSQLQRTHVIIFVISAILFFITGLRISLKELNNQSQGLNLGYF
ncbi:hypothetical protein [Shouchella patagoniensis]|uniref:hypothetical protein n=1 Tax=Shouchella patagoniensis TaxID=228576 RepID=UPI0009955E39|nr:hypothetical protein [Shouchella patagoniensis]